MERIVNRRHTLVVLKTVFRRGKSEIPESRMEILLSRVLREARREATEEERRTEGFCEFIFGDAVY